MNVARWGTWAAAGMTAIAVVGAASTGSWLRIACSLLAAVCAGACGGLVNRRAFLHSGRFALVRTIGLLGIVSYFALLPALGYGERAVAELIGGAATWRLAFVGTAVFVLLVGFELGSRAFHRDAHR